jgi:hypothetical protein
VSDFFSRFFLTEDTNREFRFPVGFSTVKNIKQFPGIICTDREILIS